MSNLYNSIIEENELDIFIDVEDTEEYNYSLFKKESNNINCHNLYLKSTTLTFIYTNKYNIQSCIRKHPNKFMYLQKTGHI